MAKIKVGDIVIDGQDITIKAQDHHGQGADLGVTTYSAVQSSTSPGPIPPPSSSVSLRQIPFPPLAWYGIGASALAAAGIGTFVLGASILLVPLVSIGLGCLGLGFLKRRDLKHHALLQTEKEKQLFKARSERVVSLLDNPARTHTVEWLVEKSGMTEETLEATLYQLVESGVVSEELSEDTGEWYYFLNSELPVEDERKYLPIAERVSHTKEMDK